MPSVQEPEDPAADDSMAVREFNQEEVKVAAPPQDASEETAYKASCETEYGANSEIVYQGSYLEEASYYRYATEADAVYDSIHTRQTGSQEEE